MTKSEAIQVSEAVYVGLEACRLSGEHNMFDRNSTAAWLYHNGYYEACVWVNDNHELYAQMLFHGLEIED